MDRRTFLRRGPVGILALASGGSSREETSPARMQVLALLESAEREYVNTHELIHWPWRYHEAGSALAAVVELTAEAWLRDRGIECKPKPHYTWLFVACDRRDETSGIPWRAMHVALCLVQRDCDPLGQMATHKDFVGSVRYTLQGRARDTLTKALDTAARCIERVRDEVVHRAPARIADSAFALR